jgi:hypothetical protein
MPAVFPDGCEGVVAGAQARGIGGVTVTVAGRWMT